MSQDFRSKNKDGTRNYFYEEIKQNELLSRNHKNVCTTLNYIEHVFTLVSTKNGCISISTFASLFGVAIGITRSKIELKFVQ